VVIERSELVMMLAVRHPPGAVVERERSPIITPPPRPQPQRTLYETFTDLDPDDPSWDRDVNPYRR
jgi:hypothetical protein